MASPSDTTHISGTDRFAHIEDISTLKALSVPLQLVFSSTSIPRLGKVASVFQRIKFHKLTFRVVPQVSTATSGGYTAAFCSDPDDHFPDSESGLAKINSQKGARTCKWWETATVPAPSKPDLLYTSFSEDEPRLGSPGSFVLGVDGRSTQSGSLTVYVDWSVTLSGPALEDDSAKAIPAALFSLWTKAGESGVWALLNPNNYSSLSQDARVAFKGVPANSYIRVNGLRNFLKNDSNSVTGLIGFHKIYVDASYKMWPSTPEDTKIGSASFGHTMLLAKGENVVFEASSSVFRQRGLKYLSYQAPCDPLLKPSTESLEQLISKLQFSKKSEISSTPALTPASSMEILFP